MINEVSKDNSDAKIADILIRGFTTGQIEIEKRIKALDKEVDKHILNLANKLNKFSENSIKNLKKYL